MSQPMSRTGDEALTALGYTQRLDRSLSRFSLFALQFSYITVVVTMFLLFGFGYSFAGPSVLWPWAAAFAGQMLVALLFCELASRYPIAGSVYIWAKKLTSGWAAWMAGWMVVLLGPITLAVIAIAAQTTLPAVWSGFQVIGSASNPTDFAENTVLLASILVVLATMVNCLRVRTLGRSNNLTVLTEFAVAVLVIVLLFAHAHRTPAVVFNTLGSGKGNIFGYFGVFMVAALLGLYQFYGFDTASSLAEETDDPHRRAPQSIITAMISSFVVGLLLIIAADVAIPNLRDSKVGVLGLSYIVDKVLGTGVGDVLVVGAFVAVFGAALAVQAAGVRIVFGMARDSQLPFSRRAAHVSGASKALIWPTVIVGVFAIAILALNIASTQVIPIISSAAIATAAIAYLFVTVPLLVARLKGAWPPKDAADGHFFSLGRFGLPINVLAVLWGVAITINLLWPRKEIFNPVPPFHWYFQYGPLLYIGLIVVVGLLYYMRYAKSSHEVLLEHRSSEATGGSAGLQETGSQIDVLPRSPSVPHVVLQDGFSPPVVRDDPGGLT